MHGCFWHRHAGCPQTTTPKTRTVFWTEKFARNVARDTLNQGQLKYLGWNVITVWECELKNPGEVLRSIRRRLDPETAAYIPDTRRSLAAAEETTAYRTE